MAVEEFKQIFKAVKNCLKHQHRKENCNIFDMK